MPPMMQHQRCHVAQHHLLTAREIQIELYCTGMRFRCFVAEYWPVSMLVVVVQHNNNAIRVHWRQSDDINQHPAPIRHPVDTYSRLGWRIARGQNHPSKTPPTVLKSCYYCSHELEKLGMTISTSFGDVLLLRCLRCFSLSKETSRLAIQLCFRQRRFPGIILP